MLKKLIYSIAFFFILLNIIAPVSQTALANSNWTYILGGVIGKFIIALVFSLILIGFEALINRFKKSQKSDQSNQSNTSSTTPLNPSVFSESKAWRENTENIYYKRNIWAVVDYGMYFFASLFIGSFLALVTMLLFASTPAQQWAKDIGVETFAFLYAIPVFMFLDVRGHLVRGGTFFFHKFAKLQITNQAGNKPSIVILTLRSILKILILPAVITFVPAILWAICYIFIVTDKTNTSPIDMIVKTKAGQVV